MYKSLQKENLLTINLVLLSNTLYIYIMKAKEIESELVTFKVTPTFKKKLQAMAEKDNRSVSNYIKNILELAMQTTK